MTRGWMDTRYQNGPTTSRVLVTAGTPFAEEIPLWPQDYTVHAGHRLILILSTETTEWDIAKLATSTDIGAPTAQIDYEQSQSYITLPAVGVSNGDDLFNGSAAVPESPLTPALIVAGLAGVVVVARRRRSRGRQLLRQAS